MFSSVDISNPEYVTIVLADGTELKLPRFAQLNINFTIDGAVTIQPNTTRAIAYTITGNTDNLTLEVLSSGSVKTKISDKNAATGTLTVTTGSTIDEYDKVVLLATNGHATTMSSISFEEAGLRINSDLTYDLASGSQTIDINIETNANYTVSIPDEAQAWISQVTPSRAWRSETITLKIEENQSDARTATISLIDEDGKPLGSIVIKQDSDFPDPATAFPDEEFRKDVLRICDINKDGRISSEEASKVETLRVQVGHIQSLEGIQYFPNLKILDCSWNELTSIDVSQNTLLTELNCSCNELTSIDVSKNIILTKLDCSRNKLTSLVLTKNTELTWLACYENELTELHLNSNWQLTMLSCHTNKLSKLDVNHLHLLTNLYCMNNNLSELEVWNLENLTALACYNNNLTNLDVTRNTLLTDLRCYGNKLTKLDVSNNTKLPELYCSNNNLTELNVSNNTLLTILHCENNNISTLDVSNNTLLEDINCSDNNLIELNVSSNTQLTKLYCSGNSLTELDLTNNHALEYLHCRNNNITVLDVSKANIVDGRYVDDYPLDCYMPTLEKLILKTGSWIRGITDDVDCSYISETTEIQYVE